MTIWARLAMLFLLLFVGISAALAETEQRVALVIGNASYATVGKLKNPANDAQAMARMLARTGFDVVEQEDGTRRAMIQAIRTFAAKLSPGGVGLFFYAGHGMQVQGINYLVPVDAALAVEDDLKYEAVDLQDVLDKLDDARVRLSIVILDACRDNPFARSFRSSARGLAQIDPPRGTIIAYSTAPGKVAMDGDGSNGLYTTELLKAMSEPGVKLQDVLARVTDAVEMQTHKAQVPWTNSTFRGDFYFIRPTTDSPLRPSGQQDISLEAQEQAAWTAVATSTTAAPLEAFLKLFPAGVFAGIAQAKIEDLKAAYVSRPQRPDDLANSAQVRNQLAQIVASRQCAFINNVVQDNGEFALSGIAGMGAEDDLRRTVSSRIYPAAIEWQVVGVTAGFCPALDLLRSIAPDVTTDQPRLGLSLAGEMTFLHDSEHIRPRLVAPNFASYLRVDYIAHDGSVQHLYPRIADRNGIADQPRILAPAEPLSLGDPSASQPGWEIGEPYGTDMIMAIASSKPLFANSRPSNAEPAAKYIRDLGVAIQTVRGTGARVVGNALLVDALPK